MKLINKPRPPSAGTLGEDDVINAVGRHGQQITWVARRRDVIDFSNGHTFFVDKLEYGVCRKTQAG